MKKFLASSLVVISLAIILQGNLLYAQPSLKDPNLKVQALVSGISSPTSMLFLDKNNIIVLEKMETSGSLTMGYYNTTVTNKC
jgi:hypothetical protein